MILELGIYMLIAAMVVCVLFLIGFCVVYAQDHPWIILVFFCIVVGVVLYMINPLNLGVSK